MTANGLGFFSLLAGFYFVPVIYPDPDQDAY
jgi:hypothetical protein